MMQSQRWATALAAAYRILCDAPSEGRRRLFDAVNEAFVFFAQAEHDARKALRS